MDLEGEDQLVNRPSDLFSGEGSFSQWIQHFESVAAVNHWYDEEKLKWLHVRVTGKAHVALTRVKNNSYPQVKETLR